MSSEKHPVHKELERCRDLAEMIWLSGGGEDVSSEIAELKDTLANLLSAPPRNCDRFKTWDEAKAACWRENADPADWRKLGEWLFALATEREGGN